MRCVSRGVAMRGVFVHATVAEIMCSVAIVVHVAACCACCCMLLHVCFGFVSVVHVAVAHGDALPCLAARGVARFAVAVLCVLSFTLSSALS